MEKINFDTSFLKFPKLGSGVCFNGGIGFYKQRFMFNLFIPLPVKILNYGVKSGVKVGASQIGIKLYSVSRSNYINIIIVWVIFRKARMVRTGHYIRGILGLYYVNIVINDEVLAKMRLTCKKPQRNPVILAPAHIQKFKKCLPAKLTGRFTCMFKLPTL